MNLRKHFNPHTYLVNSIVK